MTTINDEYNQTLREALAIEAALQRAVRDALIEHKRAGDPVVFCENGEVRWVPAEQIEIPELPESLSD